jgi:hypothetical protein
VSRRSFHDGGGSGVGLSTDCAPEPSYPLDRASVWDMRSLLVAAVVGLAFPATASATFIGSPSRNIVCQVTRSAADCIVLSRREEVVVTSGGRVTITRQHADVGDNPVRILRYGQSIRMGSIRCISLSSGMRCVHAPSGHGFKAARGGVARF